MNRYPHEVVCNMKFKEYIVREFYAHKYGVLGTVIFHLLLAICLLSVGIARMEVPGGTEIELAAPPPEEVKKRIEEKERLEEIRKKTSEEEVQRMLRSIASNENAPRKTAPSSTVQRYIDEVQEELEQGAYAGRYRPRKDKNFHQDSVQYLRDSKERLLDSLKSTFYSGESSVSYNLENRFPRFLPIPVFRCEYGGKVVVRIGVNEKGRVQQAEVVDSLSNPDICLREVAVDAALRSRFNEKPDAPSVQTGTITYHFVKQ